MFTTRQFQTMYSFVLLDHLMNPRNVGKLEYANGYGIIAEPGCDDFRQMHMRIENGTRR